MADGSPFHEGERLVQERLGVRDVEVWARRALRPFLPEQHREFYASLPFLIVAARDGAGRPWATLLAGREGFAASPDPRSLTIDGGLAAGDALEGWLRPGVDVGVLGIELETRRRNRVNGRLAGGEGPFRLLVQQSFGNCPQHIHPRSLGPVARSPGAPRRGERLTPSQRRWLASADTFFIASGYRGEGAEASFGMDASHRGGPPGFVVVEGAARIAFPDYAGNNLFNTVGNLLLDPRVGLLFVDWHTGGMLQLTGRASIDFEPADAARFPGAQRVVSIDIEAVIELPAAVPLRRVDEDEVARPVRVVERRQESADVFSFVLEARDGGPLPPFRAGQHLPIELAIPGLDHRALRSYSLSGDPRDPRRRITVKRAPGGLVSSYLHDHVAVGAVLSVGRPAGDFCLEDGADPVALVSAGVGLTPLVAMLHQLVHEGRSPRVWFLHGSRDGAHLPLLDEVRALALGQSSVAVHVALSQPRPGDAPDSVGRLDAARVLGLTAGHTPRTRFYLCGPAGFVAAMQGDLERLGVASERIRAESFG